MVIDHVTSDARGEGYASAALKKLTSLADRHDIVLKGYVSPDENGDGLNADQLFAWYERHGFMKTGNGSEIIRF